MSNTNLFVVGVAKAGTTSIHEYLSAHPNICMSRIKEPHYFTSEYKIDQKTTTTIRSKSEYSDLFEDNAALYLGESSPSYFWDASSAESIKAYNPKSKIIISLRDPMTRALSHYNMEVHAERDRSLRFLSAIKKDLNDQREVWGQKKLYIDLGLYSNGIERFRNLFGEENVLIVFYESFFSDLERSLQEIAQFLKISSFDPSLKMTNHNKLSYSSTTMKLLKRLPGRSILPESFKSALKKIINKDKIELSKEQVEFLYPYFREDLRNLHLRQKAPYYTRLFKDKYHINILRE